jgi:hypothetical protein
MPYIIIIGEDGWMVKRKQIVCVCERERERERAKNKNEEDVLHKHYHDGQRVSR